MINKASGSLPPKEIIARISDPLGDLPASRRSAIFSNVQQAARVLKRPPAPRLTSVRNELKNARKRYKENPAQHVDLSEEARLYVRAAMVEPMSRIEDWFDFCVEDIDKAIEVIEADVRSNMANRGGRMSDDRLYQFATSLAQIYADETGLQPKHTVDPVTQECTSPFNKFVLAALREFYPEGPVPWAAAREAMRRVLLVNWDPGDNVELADAIIRAEFD
jgi:hypothetical protein